jgi:hypothetical protein
LNCRARAAGLLAALIVGLAGARCSAAAQGLHCPPEAPAAWGMPSASALDQVAVLSQPAGEPIDEAAPPSLVPDRGFARGDVWHNLWRIDDQPGWSHFVDCRYRGSQRILRLKADGLRQCEQTARPYSPKAGIADNAAQTMACD